MSFKQQLTDTLSEADITVNGSRPWDPQIRDVAVFDRLARGGRLAAGETFMEGLWDVEALDVLIHKLLSADIPWNRVLSAGMLLVLLRERLFNRQKASRAYTVGEAHYDIGNDLYTRMLDSRMVYTCGYWKDVETLDEAQEAKLDLICKKANLRKGQRVLDIGCGWGSFMKYAAEHYGVECVGLSVSKEQTKLGQELCEGLPVEFTVTDYRAYRPRQQFDHIVSIEMFEAVGPKNYRNFMKLVSRWLRDSGSFVLQTIGSLERHPHPDPWIERYIFPNGVLPNRRQIDRAVRGLFTVLHEEDIGPYYDTTLMAWWKNFQDRYHELDHTIYDERFYRMWQYYLLICAGGFRSGELVNWQLHMKKVTL